MYNLCQHLTAKRFELEFGLSTETEDITVEIANVLSA